MELPCKNKKNKILNSEKALKIIARTVYKKLKDNNFSKEEVVGLMSGILNLLIVDIQKGIM